MKQRKSPFLLVGVLIVMIVGVALATSNKAGGMVGTPEEIMEQKRQEMAADQAKVAAQMTGTERKTDKDQLAKSVADSVKSAPSQKHMPDEGMSNVSLIRQQKPVSPMKPKYNETATNGQWYQKNAYESTKK